LLFELREGIDENKWDMVEKALRTPKLKRQGAFIRKSDFEKWLDVWKILFPADLYPDLPEPQHPCKCVIPSCTVLYSNFK